jgi:hypothetical protein
MIAFVLACVRLGEVGHCNVERVRRTQIRRDGDSVTGSGMGPSKGSSTKSGIYLHVGGVISSITADIFQSRSCRT